MSSQALIQNWEHSKSILLELAKDYLKLGLPNPNDIKVEDVNDVANYQFLGDALYFVFPDMPDSILTIAHDRCSSVGAKLIRMEPMNHQWIIAFPKVEFNSLMADLAFNINAQQQRHTINRDGWEVIRRSCELHRND